MAMVNQSSVYHIRVIYIASPWHVDVSLNVSSQWAIAALGATFSLVSHMELIKVVVVFIL